MKTLFIGGVHGVGKTTCCARAAVLLGASHREASEMIRSHNSLANSIIPASTQELALNQDRLAQSVAEFHYSAKSHLLLDGHYSLINRERGIERIPLSVFERLNLTGLAIFTDDPGIIANRQNQRDQTNRSADEVAAHQAIEIEHADLIASHLNLQVFRLDAFDANSLVRVAQVTMGI